MKIAIIIADTFGEEEHVNDKWWDVIPFLKDKIHYVRTATVPETEPHPHGWMCFSKYWPMLVNPKVAEAVSGIHLVRWIDALDNDQYELIELAKKLAQENDYVVWTNSWGSARGSNGRNMDPFTSRFWEHWSQQVVNLLKENKNIVVGFSSGNNGPNESGWPQSHISSIAQLIGANQRSGKPAKFTSYSPKLFCIMGGQAVAAADPKTGKYIYVNGTSFSCPAFGSLAVHYFANNPGSARGDLLKWLRTKTTLPAGLAKENLPDKVIGFGDTEPLYQRIAKDNDAWNKLKYPSGVRRAFGRMTAKDVALPAPRIKVEMEDGKKKVFDSKLP